MSELRPNKPLPDEEIVEAFLRDEPAFGSALEWGENVRQGIGDGPTLLIGDQSEISLMTPGSGSGLEYRMALLARPGDHVVLRRRDVDYEGYLSQYLGLKNVTFHQASLQSIAPVARQIWTSDNWVKAFAQTARDAGGLTINPYLTTGNTWRLAKEIADEARVPVHVCGPSPRMARRANDKLWFAGFARQVIGPGATPPTLAAYGPAATAGLVRRLSKTFDQVVIKVPDSAGSAGNLRLDSEGLKQLSLADLRAMIVQRLHATGWQDTYPVLVGVWDSDVIGSPSAQLWLPHLSDGPPVVEGIFEQRLRTEVAAFVGAARSTLLDALQKQFSSEALRIASVLQRLGYFGRCSLDAVICQTADAPPRVHWIECNGRWGGVSIPMTAAGQIIDPLPSKAMAVVQEVLKDRPVRLPDLLELWNDLLFKKGKRKSGLIIMAAPNHPRGGLINLLSVGETQDGADAMLDEAMHRLSGTARV